jgi:hypothetical protein
LIEKSGQLFTLTLNLEGTTTGAVILMKYDTFFRVKNLFVFL